MKALIVGIAVFFLLIGVWYSFALLISGTALFRESTVLGFTVVLFFLGGLYSGIQILRWREQGRVVGSILCVWELCFLTYSELFPTSWASTPSVLVMGAIATSVLVFLQLPVVRRQFRRSPAS